MAKLSGKQIAELHEALLDAFDRGDLRLLLVTLDKNLDAVVSPAATYSEQLLEVIQAAERQGWTALLLCAVAAERPDRLDVQDLINRLLKTLGATCAPEEPPPWRRWVLPVLALLVLAALVGYLVKPKGPSVAAVTPISTQSVAARTAAESPTATPIPPTEVPTATSAVTEATARPIEMPVPPTAASVGESNAAAARGGGIPITTASAGMVTQAQARWLQADGHSLDAVAISPDGEFVALAPFQDILFYALSNLNTPLFTLRPGEWSHQLAFSPDGQVLASAGHDGKIRLYDRTAGGAERGVLEDDNRSINAIAFGPNGAQLASGGQDRTVRLWDVVKRERIFASPPATDGVRSVAFSPDGSTLAAGDADGKIRVWDVGGGQAGPVLDTTSSSVDSLAFSPDGKLLVSSGESESGIRLWDTQTWQTSTILRWPENPVGSSGVSSLIFNRDGTLLASGGADGTIRLWDLRGSPPFAREPAVLRGHGAAVNNLRFTPDETQLISVSKRDGTIRFWDTAPRVVSSAITVVAAPRPTAGPETLTITQPLQMELVRVLSGPFSMGSDKARDSLADVNELPQQTVDVAEFYIGKTEVTNAQYAAFVKAAGHRPPDYWVDGAVPAGQENHPVVSISWQDAVAFTEWLSQATGRAFRLPTEAEWEKACRGPLTGSGGGRIYPWGNDWDPNRANSSEAGIGQTTPVGQYSPGGDSFYGAADMAGNVSELVSSLYQPYPYAPEDGREDLNAVGERVLRGGAYIHSTSLFRCAFRMGTDPAARNPYHGFRVAMPPVPQ